MFYEMLHALEETLFMVLTAGILTLLIGIPFGIYLYLLSFDQKLWHKTIYRMLFTVTNLASTLPYFVLVILLIPLLRILFGTEASVSSAILTLALATIFPFSAEIQRALNALPIGYNDLARSLGFSRVRWVMKVSLKEVMPVILPRYAQQLNQLMGYSVIAGVFGAGGLGGLLIAKGYQNFEISYVVATVLLVFLLTQVIRLSVQYFTHDQSH